jgi:hypothetical protein
MFSKYCFLKRPLGLVNSDRETTILIFVVKAHIVLVYMSFDDNIAVH